MIGSVGSGYAQTVSQPLLNKQAAVQPAPGASRSAQTSKSDGEVADGTSSVKSTSQTAREKLDADYAKAKADGTRVVADIANGGRFLDMSALSDDEVAAVALNKGGSFTSDEKLTAQAEIGGRMWKALAPFNTSGDMVMNVAGEQSAIKAIYPTLSQDVRDALGWTPTMLTMTDRVLATADGAKPSSKSLLDLIAQGQKQAGALHIDLTALGNASKGSIVSTLA